MKQYTTRVFKSVAGLFLLFPLIYILFVATLFDIPLNTCTRILASPFYYAVTFTVVIAGYGLWEMRRWSWYIFVLSQLFVVAGNITLILHHSESHHKILAISTACFLQWVLFLRVAREIRVPYFFPKIRWWESNPRYKFSVAATLARANSDEVVGEILDLSLAGCFVKMRTEIPQGQIVSIKFKAFGHEVRCEGRVVWIAHSAVTHPKGLGIKFNRLPRSQKRSMRFISRRVKKLGSLYRRFRYLATQDEYLKRLEQLENGA